jgi:hypothetical protein
MKKTLVVFGVAAAGLAIALVYPGLPVGHSLKSRVADRYALMTCFYLHWDGIHHKDIDMSHSFVGSSIGVNSNECWRHWL